MISGVCILISSYDVSTLEAHSLKDMASKYASDSDTEENKDSHCRDSFWSRSISNPGVSVSERISNLISSVKQTEEIPVEDREKVIDWLMKTFNRHEKSDNSIRIITVGESGVGKSALLNALIGTDKFMEAKPLSKGAVEVDEYVVDMQGIKIIVYDCPGLKDGTRNEETYLRNLQRKCPAKETDLLLYCMRIDETRIAGHKEGIRLVTQHLGKKAWKYAIVVLTFANILQIEYKLDGRSESEALKHLETQMSLWKAEVQEVLRECEVKEKIVDKLQVLPAGHITETCLPGRKYWLSDLWGHVLISMRKKHQASLVAVGEMGRGFQSEADVIKGQSSTNSPIVVTSTVEAGIAKTIGVKGHIASKLFSKCTIL